jgi:hypothetical protein
VEGLREHGNEPSGSIKCSATGGFSRRAQLQGVSYLLDVSSVTEVSMVRAPSIFMVELGRVSFLLYRFLFRNNY